MGTSQIEDASTVLLHDQSLYYVDFSQPHALHEVFFPHTVGRSLLTAVQLTCTLLLLVGVSLIQSVKL